MTNGIKKLLILVLFFYPLFLSALDNSHLQNAETYFIEKSRSLSLAQKSEWRKLLFYQNKYFGSAKGIVDGDAFYLSKEGKVNLQAELEASINAFFSGIEEDNAAQCKFPRRLKWLKSQLDDENYIIPITKCSKLEKWLEFVNPTGVVLIFSSFYINNPSSMFGHTFLRIIN